jgi:hypothetical protein
MRCPSCSAELADPEGVFCSRCGRPLQSSEDVATEALRVPASSHPDMVENLDDSDRAPDEPTRSEQGPIAPARPEQSSPSDDAPDEPTRAAQNSDSDRGPDQRTPPERMRGIDHPRESTGAGVSESAARTPSDDDTPPAARTPGDDDTQPAARTPRDDDTQPAARTSGDDIQLEHSPRSQGAAAMATEMAGSLRRALRSGGWAEAASAAGMGFLAVLGAGALFVGLLKLVDPSFGSGRSPVWVLTRVVIAGLASLGIPIEQAGVGGSILPMGTLVLIAWALVWAARAVVAAGDGRASGEQDGRRRASGEQDGKQRASGERAGKQRGSGELASQGAKVGAPFALLCCIAALIFRLREGVDTGADPGLALVIGGLWGVLFGAAGGLLADRSARRAIASPKGLRVGAGGPPIEGVMAGVTMLVSAAVAAMAAALIFVIVDLVAGTDLQLTAGDGVALAILFVAFAPNIAVGTVAFSMGAPVQFVADSLGVGFRTDFSLFGWGGSGPEWYVYFAVLIPILACLFGGYSARRRTRHPARMIEIVAVAAGTLTIGLSFLVFIGTLSLERGLLGPGNLFVLAPDASAVFLLSLLWAGALGAVGWKVAESQPRPDQHDEESRDVSGTSKV